MLATDTKRFHVCFLQHANKAGIDTLNAWLQTESKPRKKVLLLDGCALLNNPTIRSATDTVKRCVVRDHIDMLERVNIPVLDSVAKISGPHAARVTTKSLNRAINYDTVEFRHAHMLPTYMNIDDSLPRVMTLSNTLEVVQRSVSADQLQPFLPIMAGTLAGVNTLKQLHVVIRKLIGLGARSDALEEYYYYCANEGKLIRAAYQAMVLGGLSPTQAADKFANDYVAAANISKELTAVCTVVGASTKFVKIGKPTTRIRVKRKYGTARLFAAVKNITSALEKLNAHIAGYSGKMLLRTESK